MDAYFKLMRLPRSKSLILALAGVFLLGALDMVSARPKKHRTQRPAETDITRDLTVTRAQSLPTTRDGTPIIMKGYNPDLPRQSTTPDTLRQRADRPVYIPRGSSTYIPPVNPSPYSSNSPPAAALTQPAPAPYQPPKINTFSDRVNDAIHAYPLERGIGNNPIDQQQFIRQRANQ